MIAPTVDPVWYEALKEFNALGNTPKDKRLKDFVRYKDDRIREQEATIRLYQQRLEEISKLSTI